MSKAQKLAHIASVITTVHYDALLERYGNAQDVRNQVVNLSNLVHRMQPPTNNWYKFIVDKSTQELVRINALEVKDFEDFKKTRSSIRIGSQTFDWISNGYPSKEELQENGTTHIYTYDHKYNPKVRDNIDLQGLYIESDEKGNYMATIDRQTCIEKDLRAVEWFLFNQSLKHLG